MPSIDTQRMMQMVAEQTGYEVSILTSADINNYSSMTTASQTHSRHLVTIHSKHHQFGDYLVALQCAMICIKWSDPERVPLFGMADKTLKPIISKISKTPEAAKLPEAVSSAFCKMIIEGLLNQLQSLPAEMMAADMCYDLCESLRGMQMATARSMLRDITAVFSPNIKEQTPAEVYNRNMWMNAAYALYWSKKFGDETGLIPFRSMGYLQKGQELLDAYLSIQGSGAERYVAAVDKWADMLEMKWYEWHFKKERHGADKV